MRDLGLLADRIEARAQRYFSECAGADPHALRPWLVEGVTVPLSTLTYHLLNETVLHGHDIVHAAGRALRASYWPGSRTLLTGHRDACAPSSDSCTVSWMLVSATPTVIGWALAHWVGSGYPPPAVCSTAPGGSCPPQEQPVSKESCSTYSNL